MLIARENAKTAFYQQKYLSNSTVLQEKNYEVEQVKTKRIYSPREVLLLCCLIICLIITSVGLIMQHGRIIASSYELQQMQGEMSALLEEREHLRIEVKRLSSLERIEAIALNDLGLQYPEKRQWLILSARGN